MRYFGTAPWPSDETKYSQQTDADDIAAFIRGLNARPVDLVGWSYSGPIDMLVVLQHPELVHSLTVHEPGSVTYVTDAAIAKIAGEDRMAALGPVIAAAKAGDFAGAARLAPIGVNHQPDFWETTTPEFRTMFLDNARTWTLALAAPPQPPIAVLALHDLRFLRMHRHPPSKDLRAQFQQTQQLLPVIATDGYQGQAPRSIAARGLSNSGSRPPDASPPLGRHLAGHICRLIHTHDARRSD